MEASPGGRVALAHCFRCSGTNLAFLHIFCTIIEVSNHGIPPPSPNQEATALVLFLIRKVFQHPSHFHLLSCSISLIQPNEN